MRKERQSVKVADLELNLGQVEWLPRNPRQWTKADIDKTTASIREDEDFLEDRPLLVIMHGDKYIVFGGNLRTEASRKCGLKAVPAVVYTPECHEDRETVKRRAIKDNGSFGEWDFDALANEWDSKDLDDWGVDVWQANEGDNDGDDGDASEGAEIDYTHKIAVPTYEPRGDAPNIGEMYDTAKRDELLRQIEATPMPDDVRRFLADAAQRHTVFNYEKIADFYAHADAEIQSLMEKSALVIIDFDKAIENGFVKLSEDLAMQYKAEYL